MNTSEDPNEMTQYPLIDETDREIMMHRDVHFGGQFPIMLEYYHQHGKGVNPNFLIERIESLAVIEKELDQNLAPVFLDISQMEKVAEARQAYKDLRSIYEVVKPKSIIPQLIADLIFSEEFEEEGNIASIVAEKEAVVPALLNLLREEKWYDTLFPGYGLAPELAVKCLGLIGDKRAIISLFEALGEGDFFADEEILMALKQIGEPAKIFLLKVVKGKPYNEDNEKAAMALVPFRGDSEVMSTCFSLIKDSLIQQDPVLFSYLLLACEGIEKSPHRKELIALSEQTTLAKDLRDEMQSIIKSWDQAS